MYREELKIALEAAKQAADLIMQIDGEESLDVETKSDHSPVTKADKLADQLIRRLLTAHFPRYAILSEEHSDDLARLNNDFVWIVDPLDGTKDFIAKTGEFSVNIALSYQHEIVVGVIAVPAKQTIYYASKNQGSYRKEEGVIKPNQVAEQREQLIVLRSHFHRKKIEDDFLKKNQDLIAVQKPCGSSYKSCLIASGHAHYMLKIGEGTKEWDIAAADLIVREAGGYFADALGRKITYNRSDIRNLNGFVVMNQFNPRLIYKGDNK